MTTQDDDNREQTLLEEVRHAPPQRLTNGIEEVEAISSDEEEALDRGGSLALRGARRRFFRRLYGLGFGLICIFALALVGLVGVYIWHVAASGTITQVIEGILGFAFGVAATLAVEFLYGIAKKSD